MKKGTTYIIIICVLFGGLLSLYRYSLKSNDLTKIDGKLLSKRVEVVSTYKGSSRYGLIFELENAEEKYGIYLGTASQIENSNDLIHLIDTGKTYKLLVDPTVSSSNEIKLGVREIYFNGRQVFKESNSFELFLGIFLTLLSIIGLVLVGKSSRK